MTVNCRRCETGLIRAQHDTISAARLAAASIDTWISPLPQAAASLQLNSEDLAGQSGLSAF